MSDKLKAVGVSKHWLLLPKLHMTEWMLGKIWHWVQHFVFNISKNMAPGSTFRCMCNYGFCFEVYVSMTVFVNCFNFRIFGCMHNLKQTWFRLEDSAIARGEEETSVPGRRIFRATIEVGMSRNNYEMSNVSGW